MKGGHWYLYITPSYLISETPESGEMTDYCPLLFRKKGNRGGGAFS